MFNYIGIKSYNPFFAKIMFVDCDRNFGEKLFYKNNIKVKFLGQFVNQETKYKYVVIKFPRFKKKLIADILSEIFTEMSIFNYTEYEEYCKEFQLLFNDNISEIQAQNGVEYDDDF